ncbi:uncharacterized protein LOC127425185 [Myxocyprinus asiaticus]|uniref:uncharacterized protein LOC127425185 n=1 Tax=Myxocyprinus asiaticus TaxID=70543 RepID=UPI00222169A6|nr:uncharacterized protein LOC127425185 [Myxocyprinus asiaticus]
MAASRGTVVLKTVKKMIVQFCPFESNVRSTRDFLVMVKSEKARSTNMNCEIITGVKHDQSDPMIDITFMDGERLVMKGSKLTTQEMLSALQTCCSAKDTQAKAGDMKDFLVMVKSEKARSTNMNCEIITGVKHDQSDPMIDITFMWSFAVDGERLVMKGSKLTTQEMLSALQTCCSAKDTQAKAGDMNPRGVVVTRLNLGGGGRISVASTSETVSPCILPLQGW